jgi:hypothetical protein
MNLQVKLVGFEIGGIQMHLLNIFLDNFFPPTKIALIPSEFIEIIAELADMQIFRVLGCLLKLSLPEGGLYKSAQIAHSNIHRQSSIESIHQICLFAGNGKSFLGINIRPSAYAAGTKTIT